MRGHACHTWPLQVMRRHSRRRRRVEKCDDEDPFLTKSEQVCEELRHIQWRSNCSTLTLQCILDSLKGKLGKLVSDGVELPSQVTLADLKMQTMVKKNIYVRLIIVWFTVVLSCNILFDHLGRAILRVFTRL